MTSSITMRDFYQLANHKELEIIDVRESYEYQTGHVPLAKNLPLSSLSSSMTELDDSKDYYLICQSGARSEKACAFLAGQSYNVINVLGGTAAWPGELVR